MINKEKWRELIKLKEKKLKRIAQTGKKWRKMKK